MLYKIKQSNNNMIAVHKFHLVEIKDYIQIIRSSPLRARDPVGLGGDVDQVGSIAKQGGGHSTSPRLLVGRRFVLGLEVLENKRNLLLK